MRESSALTGPGFEGYDKFRLMLFSRQATNSTRPTPARSSLAWIHAAMFSAPARHMHLESAAQDIILCWAVLITSLTAVRY